MVFERVWMKDRISVKRERGKAAGLTGWSTGQEIGAHVEELTLMHLESAFPGLPHSVLIIILGDKNPIHVTDEEIEMRRSYVTCQGSHGYKVVESIFELSKFH